MKACFVGLGSIGKRHLGNLRSLCSSRGTELEVHALRSGASKSRDEQLNGLLHRQASDLNDLDEDYDAAFITNPTSLHYGTLLDMLPRAKAFFIEKPVFDDGGYDMAGIADYKDAVFHVACPLRFSPVVQKMREMAAAERVYSVRAICSSFLPDWRPQSDYRKSYSAHRELGGGVRIDLIHEWDYLISIFGLPEAISVCYGKFSKLEIESEDIAIYIARYPDKLIELHLDYFGRESRRSIDFLTERRVISGDILHSTVAFSDGTPSIRFEEAPNDKYVKEMSFFLDRCARGEGGLGPITEAVAALDVASGKTATVI